MSTLHIVFGPQGAGKSTYSKKLSKKVNGVHMSIDDWMWKLFGEDLPKSMNLNWIMKRVERCENHIWTISTEISKCGSDVILDLGFTKLEKREKFIRLAKDQNIPIQIHFVNAPHALRRKRVLERNLKKGETFSFEVTPEIFDFMEGEFEKPLEQELKNALIIDTSS